ncbi:MAG: hypothetical protein ACRDKG_09510 [Actinomycetota bacterium]
MDTLVATKCIGTRELARSSAEHVDQVERDGTVIAISRRGKLVALLIPLPERFILELEDRTVPARVEASEEVDIDELELTELACQFLIDAASTPTGFWNAPGSALEAHPKEFFRALFALDMKGLTESLGAGDRRITKEGRAVARALVRAGHNGYEETHPLGYHPDVGTDEEVA